ncbi:hypothetical protein Q4E93_18705 [Flavitalea sp. BT771]|uniref:hypothetical protein n=1 Tax=Flavitalea sp. BT771 TaxID=3063329 RepID=UPI0026E377F1|nr:hypothetical protein [Flavitalea sp. BT771]MDO6432643.1 hypothetical protein [Flavitalea sp. BT771]MDV6222081.1 hypothetical protein [Flavitalea sp. BT771]
MKMSILKPSLTGIVLCLSVALQAQQSASDNSTLKKFAFLIGDWVGEGNGQPGQGTGYFSIKPDLDGRILVRKNHTDYPATAQKAAFTHDDLMIIYADKPGELSKAIYTDNEDHTIHYAITFSDDQKTISFTSPVTAGVPTFRLSYTQVDASTLTLKFEIAPPGKPDVFNSYLEGKVHRK